MNNLRILPYKMGSESAKVLAQEIGCLRLKTNGSRWRGGLNKTLINWGSNTLPEALRASTRVLNQPTQVVLASHKLNALRALKEAGVQVPDFTTDRGDAAQWIHEGHKVVCRTLLRANSGRGIVITDNVEGMVYAPLYVKYYKKMQEYRVHVIKGEIVRVQRKARDRSVPDDQVNWQVRNHTNGFIFATEGVVISDDVKEGAIHAVEALGLDFGAVDVITHPEYGYKVLEVNTAPGLTGTTLEVYAEKFKNILS